MTHLKGLKKCRGLKAQKSLPKSQSINKMLSAAIAIRTKHPAAIHPPAIAPPAASEPAFWPSEPINPISPPMTQAMTIIQIHISVLMFSVTKFVVYCLKSGLRSFVQAFK